ncbi:MAG: AAA family ATPase, partial [Anaerolineales bacterium]|nr:AAA family ATPase [Anaerolineales bacterium]
MEKILTIQLLGNFHLLYDGETVPGIESPRLQSFLAYLLIHQDSPQSRQQLSYTFWPDSSESQARTNLRNMLYRLREVLPEADQYLDIGSQTLWWQPDAPFKTDLDDFKRAVDHTEDTGNGKDQAAHQQALKEAVEAYQGDLLPNCYDDWIIPERESLSQAYLRLLEELVEILELGQEYDAAIQAAQQLIRHDPLHENSYQLLMNLYALNGEKARAIRTYHQCVDALEKELGLDPSPAIMALYHQLMEREIEMKEPPRVSEKGSKLVGRDAPWETLQKTWNDFNQGTRLLLIMGEAGIGKTYLAEEFARWARREGINTLITHSYPTMGELAYTPVTTLLRNKLVKSKFPSLEESWLRELIRLMPELAVEYPDLPEPEHLTESWQRQRLFEASARALLSGESRLILVLDDLQWCDRETLDWLRFLVEYVSETKLMIIGTIRTEDLIVESPLINLFSDLERSNKITEILLDRLDLETTRVLAADLWGENLDEGDADRLFRETEGNPLFVAEMVRAGLITQTAADPDTRILPPKIQAVIESRLNALSPPALELATIAAVVGRDFEFDLLIRAGDGNEEALVRGLDELWGRRL